MPVHALRYTLCADASLLRKFCGGLAHWNVWHARWGRSTASHLHTLYSKEVF